jgi:hypothetical protein
VVMAGSSDSVAERVRREETARRTRRCCCVVARAAIALPASYAREFGCGMAQLSSWLRWGHQCVPHEPSTTAAERGHPRIMSAEAGAWILPTPTHPPTHLLWLGCLHLGLLHGGLGAHSAAGHGEGRHGVGFAGGGAGRCGEGAVRGRSDASQGRSASQSTHTRERGVQGLGSNWVWPKAH